MLRISKLTDYGVVVMTHLAREPEAVQTAAAVADALNLAQPTVSKLLKSFTRAGLLRSYRGTQGGYQLGRRPAAISVLEVIDAVEGRLALTECSAGVGSCLQEEGCALRGNWTLINGVVRQALQGVSLAQMTRPLHQGEVAVPLQAMLAAPAVAWRSARQAEE
ncbi:MAG: SUF system Fe-S cluster assembly regulator [Pseudomonadota bacterium]|nr:SUF system Fe-S cluster assembly regulator [Pseudomonadota bacterium]HJO34780.1 SUF system Fe-S cluster assembly regulator [Gammaproteobacteria bacterium]